MRYAALLFALGVSLAGFGARLGGALWILAWPAASFIAVAVAYLADRPTLLGKRRDGTFAVAPMIAFGPYLLFTWATWYLVRGLGREAAANEVAPGLWVGRRVLGHEVPSRVLRIVDLTAELPAAIKVRRHPGYLCVPVLDGTAPAAIELRALVERLRGEGDLLVHCASGHGRSATVAAAILLDRGLAPDPSAAEAMLRQARPGIRLNPAQRRALAAMVTR